MEGNPPLLTLRTLMWLVFANELARSSGTGPFAWERYTDTLSPILSPSAQVVMEASDAEMEHSKLGVQSLELTREFDNHVLEEFVFPS